MAIKILFFLVAHCSLYGQNTYELHTVAFYNLENLFDTIDNPKTWDNDWTPNGRYRWATDSYHKKLEAVSSVIREVGTPLNPEPPVMIGLCEVENKLVLEDLINQKYLRPYQYDYVHYDSPDRRGIDVALLYRTQYFYPYSTKKVTLPLNERRSGVVRPIYTRDQLVVSGKLQGSPVHIVVNHWPSRRGGKEKSDLRRQKAANLCRSICDSLLIEDRYAAIIVMGDFNDDPSDTSIKFGLKTTEVKDSKDRTKLYNPMGNMYSDGFGTLAYQDGWNLFDQILVSSSLVDPNTESWLFYQAGIHNDLKLISNTGKYEGYPRRGMQNDLYTGGFSDHLPVYIYLIRRAD